MNLREFTETVDLRAKEKTKEDLQMLVHSLARKVLEENREEFLAMIEQAGKTQPSEKESKDTSQRMKALDKAEVKKEYARLKRKSFFWQKGMKIILPVIGTATGSMNMKILLG